jgi:hypothetical protein
VHGDGEDDRKQDATPQRGSIAAGRKSMERRDHPTYAPWKACCNIGGGAAARRGDAAATRCSVDGRHVLRNVLGVDVR